MLTALETVVMTQEAPGRLSGPQSSRSAVNTAALLLICIWAYRPSEPHSERERERERGRDHGLELSANGSGGGGGGEVNCK